MDHGVRLRRFGVTVILALALVPTVTQGDSKVLGLYASDADRERIQYLDPTNFDAIVRKGSDGHAGGAATAWLVEFYAAWCGHCQRFAKPFREFADSVKPWRAWVRVGAIDCGNANNSETCSKHNISGFPTLKIFPAGASAADPDPPALLHGRTRQALRQSIATHLANGAAADLMQPLTEAHIGAALSNATPRTELWILCNTSRGMNYTLPWGWELALDLSSRVTDPNTAVHLVHGDESGTNAAFPGLRDLITAKKPLGLVRFMAVDGKPRLDMLYEDTPATPGAHEAHYARIHDGFLVAGRAAGVLRDINDADTGSPLPMSTQPTPPPSPDSPVQRTHAGDVRDAIAAAVHALWQEVPMHGIINGDKLAALQRFTWTIARALPTPHVGMLEGFLQVDLYKVLLLLSQRLAVVVDTDATLTSSKYKALLNEVLTVCDANDLDIATIGDTWHHCKGSKPHLRGFPCGLWTLFHTLLSVATLRGDDAAVTFDAIVGYVVNFFGCRECSDNFMQEAQVWIAGDVPRRPYGSAVLFLWTVHNKANLRLGAVHDAPNNDPAHPKEAFPSRHECSQCWVDPDFSNGIPGDVEWNVSAVLEHLLERYGIAARQQAGRSAFAPRMLHGMHASLRNIDGTFLYTDESTGSVVREEGSMLLTHFGVGPGDAQRKAAALRAVTRTARQPRDAHSETWLWRLWLVIFASAIGCIIYLKLNPMALTGKHSPLLPTSIRRKNID